MNCNSKASLIRLVVGLMIKDRLGHEMFGINSHRLSLPIENLTAGSQHEFPASA